MQDDYVTHALERAGEVKGDIVPEVFQRYHSACPEAEALMSHMDTYMKGRMLEEVLRLVLSEDYEEDDAYLNYEVRNHRLAYGVQNRMYPPLLGALQDTVRDALGDEWTTAVASAWERRMQSLLDEIERRAA